MYSEDIFVLSVLWTDFKFISEEVGNRIYQIDDNSPIQNEYD